MPRSPDLTPCDFFLWGSILVEQSIFHVLRQRITDAFDELRQQRDFVRRERCMLCSGELNFVSREMWGISKDMALNEFNSR